MTVPARDEPMTTPSEAAPAPKPRRWRFLIPYLLTALITLAMSVAVQLVLLRTARPILVIPTPITLPTALPVEPTAIPTLIPAPPPDPAIVRQEIADLRAEQNQLWTAIYLSRALNQLADAEALLRANELTGVEQALLAVDDSLARAYENAESPVQEPIARLRRDIDNIRDDLFLYPEQIDRRLIQVRQFILTLIEQRQ
jgi:hypothetical protein